MTMRHPVRWYYGWNIVAVSIIVQIAVVGLTANAMESLISVPESPVKKL